MSSQTRGTGSVAFLSSKNGYMGVLNRTRMTDGGSGRLLLSGGFAGHETFDCATLESDPFTWDNVLQPRPGFVAKIAR
jgi:hypothetical protein